MRVARVAGAVVLVGAATWAAATVAAYAVIIRWSARIDDNTYATIHPFNPEKRNHG